MRDIPISCFVVGILFALCACTDIALAEEGYGTITGQFVIDGPVPTREVKIQKGAEVKDAECCAAHDMLNEDLVVDPATKGIRHIFVYLKKAKKVHPDLKESKQKELVQDQKGCAYVPHTLLVRTDQHVMIKSNDPISHNTHTFPIRGQAVNFMLKPSDRVGQKVVPARAESLPIPVKCDIHPWMVAYWLILDHPYMAVTAETGKFTIESLPVGQYEFTAWHERMGYVSKTKADYGSVEGSRRGFEVSVEDGKTIDIGAVKIPVASFR